MTSIQLIQVLKTLFPSVLEVSGYTLAVDGSGNAIIDLWDTANGTQPTTDELNSTLASIGLKTAQQTQIAVLQAAYGSNGYAPVPYMGASFPSDPNTLLLLSCTLIQGSTPQSLPSGFQWFNSTGTGVSMTLLELQGLGNAIFAQVYAAYVKLQGLIAQVETASTVTAVQAVGWS